MLWHRPDTDAVPAEVVGALVTASIIVREPAAPDGDPRVLAMIPGHKALLWEGTDAAALALALRYDLTPCAGRRAAELLAAQIAKETRSTARGAPPGRRGGWVMRYSRDD